MPLGSFRLNTLSQAIAQALGLTGLYALGTNTSGQLGNTSFVTNPVAVPTSTSGALGDMQFLQTSAGNGFSLGITTSGELYSWGSNANGKTGQNTIVGNTLIPTRVGTSSNWTQVAAGSAHALALNSAGEIYSWGQNGNGSTGLGTTTGNTLTPTKVGTASNWTFITTYSAGDTVFAINSLGELWGWGVNDYGQLGLNNTTYSYNVPTRIGTATNWVKISAGIRHSLAINSLGYLYSCGENGNGKTGLFSSSGNTLVFTRVGSASNWSQVSAGSDHSLAIKTDGTLWAWGNDASGQCGLGSGASTLDFPQQVGTATNWSKISAGTSFSLVINSLGHLYSSGSNNSGQTGQNVTTGNTSTLTRVGTGDTWAKISAGPTFSEALTTSNKLWSWGAILVGQTGLPFFTSTPTLVNQSTSNPTSISCSKSGSHALAVYSPGTLWGWGTNSSGQVGIGNTNALQTTPIQIGTSTNWTQVSAGITFSIAINSSGELYSWGANANGQTGLNTTTGNTLVPTRVGTASNWTQVAAGSSYSLAINSSGELYSWGSNANGRTGLNTTTGNTLVPTRVGTASNWTQVAAGVASALAINSSGELYSWGSNANGRTGLNTDTGNTLVPTRVGTASNWTQISMGTSHGMAINSLGELYSWGANANGRTGLNTDTGNTLVPTLVGTASNWTQVNVGSEHSLIINSSGEVHVCGLNSFGQIGLTIDPTSNTSSVQLIPTRLGTYTWNKISAGNNFSFLCN